jgi:hypothetical protein
MSNIRHLFLLALPCLLLTVCGCGESKEEKAARELRDAAKEAASQFEKLRKQ